MLLILLRSFTIFKGVEDEVDELIDIVLLCFTFLRRVHAQISAHTSQEGRREGAQVKLKPQSIHMLPEKLLQLLRLKEGKEKHDQNLNTLSMLTGSLAR